MIAAALAVVVAGASYPVAAISEWIPLFNPERAWIGLDGLRQNGEPRGIEPEIAAGRSPDDVAAIRWLNDHARDGDVLLEGPGCQYRILYELPTSRFSAFTGIPTLIGWAGAEQQWRGGQPELEAEIALRQADVAAMYADPNPATNPRFDRYNVTLLVLGDLERFGNDECAIAGPFPAIERPGYPGEGWTLVYEDGNDRIYRRSER
jgi:uncharacterized membrane protein